MSYTGKDDTPYFFRRNRDLGTISGAPEAEKKTADARGGGRHPLSLLSLSLSLFFSLSRSPSRSPALPLALPLPLSSSPSPSLSPSP